MLCHFCAEHSDYTPEQVSDIFKLRAGLTQFSKLADGTIIQHPGSISFAAMDQDEFDQFYDRVMDVVATDILPGVQRADVQRELMELIR